MDRFTLADCKKELIKRNADSKGTKAVLIGRLRNLIEAEGVDFQTFLSAYTSDSHKDEELGPHGKETGSQIVNPEDSVSQTSGQSRGSNSSWPSSIRVTRAKEAARKAGLMAKAHVLELKRKQESESLKIQHEKERLDIEAELVEIAAREKVLSDLESEAGRKSKASSTRSSRYKPRLSAEAVAFQPSTRVTDTLTEGTTLRYDETIRPLGDKAQTPAISLAGNQDRQTIPRNRLVQVPQRDKSPIYEPATAFEAGRDPYPFGNFMECAQNCDTQGSESDSYVLNNPRRRQHMIVLQQTNNPVGNDSRLMETLVEYNLKSLMPKVEVRCFSGDYTQYTTFVRSFETLISSKLNSEEEKLYYLEQFTTGEPQEIVRACLHMPSEVGYLEARRMLRDRYGKPERIAYAYVEKLLSWPSISNNDVQGMSKFSIMLETCKNAFTSVPYGSSGIEHPKTIRTIMEKLPIYMQNRWRRQVDRISEDERRGASFRDFVNFVKTEVRILSNPFYGKQTFDPQTSNKKSNVEQKKYSNKPKVVAQVNIEEKDKILTLKPLKCFYCEKDHHLSECSALKNKPDAERKEFLMTRGLCFGCLRKGHIAKNCTRKLYCRVCKRLHPTLLHRDKPEETVTKANSEVTTIGIKKDSTGDSQKEQNKANVGVLSHKEKNVQQKMCIIPVKVKSRSGHLVPTYAFLDSGSSASFCTKDLLQKLSLDVDREAELNISTILPNSMEMKSAIVSGMEICDPEENNFIRLPPMYSLDRIPVEKQDMITAEDLKMWPHLQCINLPEYDAEIGLMLGNNVPQAVEPWEIINSNDDGAPFAIKTKLGWVVAGTAQDFLTNRVKINRVKINDESVDQMLENLYNQEFQDVTAIKRGPSEEDKQWIKRIEDSCSQQSNGHYQIALPFRKEIPDLPNNKCIAMKRLDRLKSKLAREPIYHEKYSAFMNDLLEKGHAEPVSHELDADSSGKWYMPHHGVFHPQKPEKLRVVFDCAAKFRGSSLNDHLLQGPDLANPLVEVLIAFRCGPVAFIADVESMFYQVRVPPSDRDYLRFFWFPNGNLKSPPIEYRMTVHVFGATSSPSCANFALQKTARDYRKDHLSKSYETVTKNFYIDDCLKSAPDENSAVELAHDVKALCNKGGFKLTKFTSNSRQLLQSFDAEFQSKNVKEIDLCRDTLPNERALGMLWNVNSDTLNIAVNLSSKPCTKRGILSTIGTMYDPLGIVSPSILQGRLLMQELCRQKIGWDEEIPESQRVEWELWKGSLPDLANIKVGRSYVPSSFGNIRTCQLHHFSDASEKGYGCVSYLRFEDDSSSVHCSFVFGKSRVAPLKPVTIPRLELMAATIAVRVNYMVMNALEVKIDQTVFWTDSTTVLKYIRNDKARFHTFVANRVSVIRDGSQKDQWRYVDSASNPADCATRGTQTEEWLKGPNFLYEDEGLWPVESLTQNPSTELLEVKSHVALSSVDTADDSTHRLLNYFSDWHKLKKSVAWLINFRSLLRFNNFKPKRFLTVGDLNEAERSIISLVQCVKYADEIAALKEGNGLKKNSPIVNLNPVLDNGLLVVGGRICNSPLPHNVKHQVILPYKHHVTDIIIKDCHERFGHVGRQHVLSLLREKFWIVKGNSAVRRVLHKCVKCKRMQAPVLTQQMANLPVDRVTPEEPPFTRTGIDCFGPFYTKRGRAQVKRYGVLFTCLVTRAIHVEVADSLSTDSFINALRRFVTRRGHVKVLKSDRGTNFIGADKELKNAIKEWNEKQIHETMLKNGIDWSFNPPYASHFGGVWERMIRSVRKILQGVLEEQTLSDEALVTLMCEVEAIVNSRPLTTVSSDMEDLLPLTPNHLLNLKGSPMCDGVFTSSDTHSRKRWRHVQYLSDLFWKRWRREYLVNLQERQKWCKREKNLKVGDIVLVVDETLPRCHWSLGRVLDVEKGTDGMVRKAKVKCIKGIIDRSISKLVLLCEE